MKRDAAWSMRGDSISLPSISLVLENLGLMISFFSSWSRGGDRMLVGGSGWAERGVWADQLLDRVKEQEVGTASADARVREGRTSDLACRVL